MNQKKSDGKKRPSASFVTGAIALAFLITGYQTALFVHRAAALKVVSDMTSPDTVFVYADGEAFSGDKSGSGDMVSGRNSARASWGYSGDKAGNRDMVKSGGNPNRVSGGYSAGDSWDGSSSGSRSGRNSISDPRRISKDASNVSGYHDSESSEDRSRQSGSNATQNYRYEKRPGNHPEAAAKLAAAYTPRTYESFRFNPNTVSVSDLCRLGFSLKQANSIDNYRKKGGRFKRKQDFAKSFVVADSVYRRLEKYIDIPLLDLNAADSAAFDELPGIGGYFAAKMVEYRGRLGGYSCPEQLLDIYHFDAEKLAKIRDLVEVKTRPEPFRLWSLPADSLKRHPYIKTWQTAKSIVLYRENNPRSELTVDGLVRAGILDKDMGAKLSRCLIESP